MIALFEPARRWWDGRTTREQRMLGGLGLFLGLLAIWFLILQPAWAWRAAAAERRLRAESEAVLVQAGLVRLSGSTFTGRPIPLTDLEAVARRSAETSGLTVQLATDGQDGVSFVAPSASTSALFGWLARLKAEHSVEAFSVSVAKNDDATLSARGSLRAGRKR